ncbi:hypothetical protein [Nocardioides zeae]
MSVLGMDPDALRHHAARVEAVAAEPRSALEAARTTAAGHDAFGVLCSFLVPVLAGTQATGIAACAAAVGSLEAAATEVRVVATGVEVTDATVAATATGISRTVAAVREQVWPVAGEELVRGTVRETLGAVVEASQWLDRLEGTPVSPAGPRPGPLPVGVPAPGAGVAP